MGCTKIDGRPNLAHGTTVCKPLLQSMQLEDASPKRMGITVGPRTQVPGTQYVLSVYLLKERKQGGKERGKE